MKAIVYCYGDGHPMILGGENLTDADRQAIVSHPLIQPKAAAAISEARSSLQAALHQLQHGEASDFVDGTDCDEEAARRDLCCVEPT